MANATPEGLPVVANARQFNANVSMTVSASPLDIGGVGRPCRSWIPLYRRIAGSALASAMKRASALGQGRRVTQSSERVATGPSPPASLTSTSFHEVTYTAAISVG